MRKLVGKLDQWRMCMSHNESYFGEPVGLVKSISEELARAVDPIYPPQAEPVDPLAGVAIYTATVPFTATTRPTPEAQDVARYRWLRQFDIGIDHQGYDDYRWYAYAKPEPRNGRLGLDAVIDAALALPAQGEGNNG